MRPAMTQARLLEKKIYRCPYCGGSVTHAKAREHWAMTCPQKPRVKVRGG
jgi:hypothetical protein